MLNVLSQKLLIISFLLLCQEQLVNQRIVVTIPNGQCFHHYGLHNDVEHVLILSCPGHGCHPQLDFLFVL